MEKWKNIDWLKVGKGALLAGAGAAVTYLYGWATGSDLGTAGPAVAAVLSVLANLIRKYAQAPGTTPEAE